jgi:predicted small metal-binding protein
MLQAACSDAGFSCNAVFVAQTEEEIQNQIEEHAMAVHGLEKDDFTPDLLRKIKSMIRRS